ncbi:response regulator transcription factor [Chitinophaga sp. G-6-1-13]|uniref:Response regulator transcription factor n=1 Tax=Chitinophaga fulva TaxID=2728842 RepID=A0A848GI05_9BACT|nr:response regulator transcription factor [Chitinophaga fulva]NML37846.1 response regulator transcription factor [Chitinophaga fulva]
MKLRPINLAILDKQTLFTEMLTSYLREYKEINKIVHAVAMQDLLIKLRHSVIDLLILDPHMQDIHFNQIIQFVQEEHPGMKILMLSENVEMFAADQPTEHRVYGYLSKSDSIQELLEAIIASSDEQIYRNKRFTEILYFRQQYKISKKAHPQDTSLNEREVKLLKLLWEEKSNKEIAEHLFLGIRSVEKLRQNMKEKLGVQSTVGLLKYGIKQGFIPLWEREYIQRRHYEKNR